MVVSIWRLFNKIRLLILILNLRSWRTYRLLALSRVLSAQAASNPALRVKTEALLLTAACVWLINSLHSRPDDGSAGRSLMHAVLPLVERHDADPLYLAYAGYTPRPFDELEEEEEDDDDDEAVPVYIYGAIFLRQIMQHQTPRMRIGGPNLTESAFKHFFGVSVEVIEYKYFTVGIIPPDAIAETRIVTNKAKRTPVYHPAPGTNDPILFSLGDRGHQLPPRPVDSGSDVEDDEFDHSDDDDENIDKVVNQLFRQLLIDIIHKVPNPRGVHNPSYCILDRAKRLSVNEDFYMDCRLPAIWERCQYKHATRKDYELSFNHLFPPREHQTSPKVQNYLQCQYYIKWKRICSTAKPATIDAIRAAIKERVFKFQWLPHATQDKLWSTHHLPGFIHYPAERTGPAPRVLFKGTPELV